MQPCVTPPELNLWDPRGEGRVNPKAVRNTHTLNCVTQVWNHEYFQLWIGVISHFRNSHKLMSILKAIKSLYKKKFKFLFQLIFN